jgi:hypothetical protein
MSQFFVLNIAAATFFIGFFISDVILSRAVFAVGAAVFVYGFTLNDQSRRYLADPATAQCRAAFR